MEQTVLKKIILLSLTVTFGLGFASDAISARGNSNEVEPPRVYTERARQMLNKLAVEEEFNKIDPLTEEQQKELKDILRKEDRFVYDQPDSMIVGNKKIPVSLQKREIIRIKLGHTYRTTIVATDASGNPWSLDILSEISDSDVVQVDKIDSHILAVRPKKRSGETNLPIKLAGEQYPIILLFDIGEDEVYFNVDLVVDGLGDSIESQRAKSISYFNENKTAPPKLNLEPAKEQMLQFITPDGYYRTELTNSYGERVDPRDFMGWKKDGKLYIITPHLDYSPEPIDISASSDGRHKLFEYVDTSVVMMRKNNQIIMLYAR